MPGLILKLRPYEKFLINGTLLQNGPRQGQVSIEDPDAAILRLSDAIHPSEATTPVRQVYYLVQLVISRDVAHKDVQEAIHEGVEALINVFQDDENASILRRVKASLEKKLFYSALLSLKKVMVAEQKLINVKEKSAVQTRVSTEAA